MSPSYQNAFNSICWRPIAVNRSCFETVVAALGTKSSWAHDASGGDKDQCLMWVSEASLRILQGTPFLKHAWRVLE